MELRAVSFVHNIDKANIFNSVFSLNDVDSFLKKLKYVDVKFEYFKNKIQGDGFVCESPSEYRRVTMLMEDEAIFDINVNFLRLYGIRMYVDDVMFIHPSLLNKHTISYLENIEPNCNYKVLFKKLVDISMRTPKMINAMEFILENINTETKELEKTMYSKIKFGNLTDEDICVFVDVVSVLVKRYKKKMEEL